jgi:glycosyltransferase involved in cell wall biosynthesis
MRVVYIWLSYFPCQIGKTDLEKVAEQAASEYDTHILVKNNKHQKSYEYLQDCHIHRFFSFWEYAFIDDLVYSFFLPLYCCFMFKNVSVFHIYNPFYSAWLLHLLLRMLFPSSKVIFDIRTWPLKEWLKKKLNYRLITLAHLTATHTIIISKQLLRHFFWYNKKKVSEIALWYTPVDDSKFLSSTITTNTKNFIYIGSIYPRRWIDHMLTAFKLYFNKYPHDTLFLVWWGDEAYYSTLKHTYTGKNFIYRGKVPHQEIPSYLLDADYGIAYIPQSSYFMDQPPLKTIEYLWHWLPVLGTNTNGNKIFITPSNWLLVEDTIESTYKGILELRKKFSNPAKKEISNTVSQYTRKSIYQKIRSLYK